MDEIPKDDGFKWFGEGFDGFSRRLPEDSVEYTIYAIDKHLENFAALRTTLNKIIKTTESLKKKLLREYIWQRDDFEVKIQSASQPSTTTSNSDQPQHLYLKGRTNFGDSIADEWLIVYLLLETSKQHPEAWIRVFDTDGEFLLIEAANVLPKWLNPDIAEHRVWINNGHLRIVPLLDDQTPRNLSLSEALSTVRNKPESLIISPFIEDEAFYRLKDYPSKIGASLHHAMTTIPRRLAYLLHRNPTYISPAIEAFYLRDPISLKPLDTKDLATLVLPPDDFVTVSVRFTKVGFAQLKSQVFDTPPSWVGIAPRLRDAKMEIGMKLTCGFEMLLADPQNQDRRVVRESKILLQDIEDEHDQLPDDLEIAQWPQVHDDEKWLDIDYRDFENELSGKNKTPRSKGDQNTTSENNDTQENLRQLVSRFEDFLNDDEAGIDGVGDESDPPGSDVDDETDNDDDDFDEEDQTASFDEADFERAMKEMMGMPADHIEKSGLLAEARKLAIEDAEDADDNDADHVDDEDMKRIMELMERELKTHGALRRHHHQNSPRTNPPSTEPTRDANDNRVVFRPEPPTSLRPPSHKGKSRAVDIDDNDDDEIDVDEEFGPGDEELSSDDDGDEFNDINADLVRNMLEAFKGQAGMAGPAGNMMRAMGVNLPRDED